MALCDISHPVDIRLGLNKPCVSTAEITEILADPTVEESTKDALLADVTRQGYVSPPDAHSTA